MFGEITNSELLGGWTFKFEKADKLPQNLASAVSKLLTATFGARMVLRFLVRAKLL